MRKLFLILALLTTPAAYAQGFFYKIDPPAPDATIRVCPMTPIGPTPNPCTNPAPTFSDMALTVPARNPVSLGPDGAYAFWIAAGQYFIQYSGSTSTRTVVFEFGGTGGGGTTPSWFLNNSLVGTEPNYDVIPGTNVTITATDDPGATRVHYTVNASGGGGGSGITPCSTGVTFSASAPWTVEAANTLVPTTASFNPGGGGTWHQSTGWIPVNDGSADLCSSLFLVLPGTTNNAPLMATANSNNRTVAYWGPNFGFHIGTCIALTDAGYPGIFPSDGACIGAVGHFDSFYNTTWNNTNLANSNNCADQLNPPEVICTNGSSGKVGHLGAGYLQLTAGTFSSIGGCGGSNEGTTAPVTDSTTNTWGATITGSGGFHVLAYCNGTNWTVAAK